MTHTPSSRNRFRKIQNSMVFIQLESFRLNKKSGLLLLGLGFIVVFLVYPTPKPLIHNNYSQIIIDENGALLRAFLNENQQWCFPPDETTPIPDKLKKAVTTFEDARFYWHFGVDIPERRFYHRY